MRDKTPEAETSLPEDRLWLTPEVAKFLRISERTVREWMRQGRIPYIKIGHSLRFDKHAILRALKTEPKD